MRRLGGLAAAALAAATLTACSSLHIATVSAPEATPSAPAPSGWIDSGLPAPPLGVACPTPDSVATATGVQPHIGAIAPPLQFDSGRLRIDPPPSGADPPACASQPPQRHTTALTVPPNGKHAAVGPRVALQ